MAFTRIRTIKGRQYRYLEERWREGGKVRSRSISLGPMDEGPRPGFLKRLFPPSYGFDWAKIEREELHRIQTAKANRDEVLKGLHDAYGMVLGPANLVPIDKPLSMIDLTSAAAAPPSAEQAEPSATFKSGADSTEGFVVGGSDIASNDIE